MLTPTMFLLGLGLISAICLSIASRVFYVWEDPKIEEVENALLGANCGGCGFAGCAAAARSVVEGKSGADVCIAGGADIAQKTAEIMGVEIEIKEPEISTLSCHYNVEEADTRFNYIGVNDCRAAVLYGGGTKVCPIGCLGLGTCVRACPFAALEMGDGLPVVNIEKCRSCGICVEICPKNIVKLSSSTKRMIEEYTFDECTSPCQRTCPTGIDIPGYIKQIKKGDYRGAIKIIKEKNPLPLITGRICPAPCEYECRRNLKDDPVGINNLKRFVADYEMNNGGTVTPYKLPDTGIQVAVIGGGAQGLTTSYYLACLGYQPTIFESTSKLGGIIRNIIPGSRLPENIIDFEVNNILNSGIKAELESTLGKDITIGSLLESGYKSVILSNGGLDSRKIMRGNIDLEQVIPGVYLLLDFLTHRSNINELKIGKDVYIIGLGNSTLESARICLKKGAKNITILYPYIRDEINSRNLDLDSLESEGIKFRFSTVVTKLIGEQDQLTKIVLQDADGITEEVTADTLVVSTGRLSDMVFVSSKDEDTSKATTNNCWETIEIDKAIQGMDM